MKTYMIYFAPSGENSGQMTAIEADRVQPLFVSGPDSAVSFFKQEELVAQFVMINIVGWILLQNPVGKQQSSGDNLNV